MDRMISSEWIEEVGRRDTYFGLVRFLFGIRCFISFIFLLLRVMVVGLFVSVIFFVEFWGF